MLKVLFTQDAEVEDLLCDVILAKPACSSAIIFQFGI